MNQQASNPFVMHLFGRPGPPPPFADMPEGPGARSRFSSPECLFLLSLTEKLRRSAIRTNAEGCKNSKRVFTPLFLIMRRPHPHKTVRKTSGMTLPIASDGRPGAGIRYAIPEPERHTERRKAARLLRADSRQAHPPQERQTAVPPADFPNAARLEDRRNSARNGSLRRSPHSRP